MRQSKMRIEKKIIALLCFFTLKKFHGVKMFISRFYFSYIFELCNSYPSIICVLVSEIASSIFSPFALTLDDKSFLTSNRISEPF